MLIDYYSTYTIYITIYAVLIYFHNKYIYSEFNQIKIKSPTFRQK